MPDRTYAIAIAVILVICCLGMYVAVSGYLNANVLVPQSAATLAAPATVVVVVVSTQTPAATRAPAAVATTAATAAPVPSPLGVFQTITASTSASVPVAGSTIAPTARPATVPAAGAATAASGAAPSCSGFAYCPMGGTPDRTLGIGGEDCPRNYVWGRVMNASGQGQANVIIRYRSPNNETGQTVSKGAPDPVGKYDILAAGGTFSVWVSDSAGRQLSPPISVESLRAYSGSGNCPTRVDFKAQK